MDHKFNLHHAIACLDKVFRQYKGTADDHKYLKFCLSEIYKRLKPPLGKPDLKPVPDAE